MPDPTSHPPSQRRSGPPIMPYIAGRVGHGSGGGGPREPNPPRPPALSGAPDPSRLLQALGRRWVLAVCLGLTLGGVAAASAWNLLSPKHSAFVYVRIATKPNSVATQAVENKYEFNTYVKSQIARLKSRYVLERALAREEVKRLNLEKKYPDLPSWLETELKVESAPDNEMVKLVISCNDPEDARVLVDAVAKTYIKEVVDKEESERAADVSRLERVYNQANAKLREKKQSLARQVDDIGTLDSEVAKAKYSALQTQLSDARARHSKMFFDLMQLKGRLEIHKAGEKEAEKFSVPDSALNEAVETDPILRQDLALIQAYRDRLTSLAGAFTNPHNEPRYLTLANALRDVEVRVGNRRGELRKTLDARSKERAKTDWQLNLKRYEAEVAALKPQEEMLAKLVDQLAREAQKFGKSSAEIDIVKGEVNREEALVGDFGRKLEKSRYDLLATPRVTIYQEAALMALERKKQILGVGAGSLMALGVACGGVALWEFRRRRIHSTDEVARGLGIPVVGAVPASPLVEQLINAPPEEEENDPVLLESIDAIRTQLLRGGPDGESSRILMVTSAEGGEGKTTLASHLASSLSRAGRKTLLIDGDLRQPALHQFFEVNAEPGLSEVLLGEVDTVDAILPTNVDGLMVLPAGQWDREVIASMARGGIQGILEKLKEEFDFIVVDSHPVLSTNDSLLIGQNVDAVLLSVLREVSQTPMVYAAAQRMNALGIRVLGAVVIGTDPEEVYTPSTPSYTAAAA